MLEYVDISISSRIAREASDLREFTQLVLAEQERLGLGPQHIMRYRYADHLLHLVEPSGGIKPNGSNKLQSVLPIAAIAGAGALRSSKQTPTIEELPTAFQTHDRRSVLKMMSAVGAAAAGMVAFGYSPASAQNGCNSCTTTWYSDCVESYFDSCFAPWGIRVQQHRDFFASKTTSGYCYNYCRTETSTQCATYCPA